MPDLCLVHGGSNRSDMNAGISAHFSPTIKSERDTWLRFVLTHCANLNPSGKFVAGVFSPFRGGMISRAFHMEGCRRRLIPGSSPTIRTIEPGKQSSKRQHRKVSLVQFYLSFSIVSAMKFFFVDLSILYVYSQTSLRFVNIFSSNSLSLVLFISPRCWILVFFFIPSVYSSHVARLEDAGLLKSLSMVSKVFKSTVHNLRFFSQTQVSLSTFHIHHK